MRSAELLLFLWVTCTIYLCSVICNRCCEISYHGPPRYELLRNNSRSNQAIVSRRAISNVSECEDFAASKKALAFNFVSAKDRAGRQRNICQALRCPEDHNMTTLVPTENCRYYSMYHAFIPPVNTSVECVPKAGMFMLSYDSLNYTQARNFCRNLNASLAHIISEVRTDGLGKLVPPDFPNYVGLSNSDKEKIWKNEYGEPLACFDYRAWGEGQPSKSRGCVALVNPAKNSPSFWKVVPCYTSLPFICEFPPLPQRRG